MTSSKSEEPSGRRTARNEVDARFPVADRALDALCVSAFWTAVVLPFAAGAVLLTGLESPAEWRLFGAVLVSSVVSLYVGYPDGAP